MRALKFVQEEIRYLSLSIGENSHRPYPPAEVLARRYGDCKDKTWLLVSILRRMNIAADPVLVATQLGPNLPQLLPSPALFDHMIARVQLDGKTYYLDPTLQGQGGRLESLAPTLANTHVFVITPNAKALVAIPAFKPNEGPTRKRREVVRLARLDQPAEMEVDVAYTGEDAENGRRYFGRLSPAQIHKVYSGLLDQRYPKAELIAAPEINDDREQNALTVRMRYRIPNFMVQQGERWRFSYETSNLTDLLPPLSSAKRRLPLFLGAYPRLASYQLEVNLPDDFDAYYRPSERSLKNDAFTLDENLVFKGQQLKLDLTLKLAKDRIPADKVVQYMEDLRNSNTYFRGSFFVSSLDRRVTTLQAPLREVSRTRQEQSLKATEKAIREALIAGRETANSRCEHALSAAYLEQFDLAKKEADNAVAEMPNSPEMLRCRGSVRFILGDFKNSSRDLSRALALGDSDPETYFQRGLAACYTQQWRQAIDDFAMAGKRSDDERSKARAAIWRVLAMRANGQPVQVENPGLTAWPAPVFDLLAGKTQIEDVVDLLNKSERGHQQEESLAEAYFYYYQMLASSNRPKARAYLKRAVDLGPWYGLIPAAARYELRQQQGNTP